MATRDIILVQHRRRGKALLSDLEGRRPVFMCVLGTTETAKIPGISAAGRNPGLTDYTPAADAELLLLGRCECISGVPVTPEGIPTPALITRSALETASIPALALNGGVRVRPHVPFLDLNGTPGRDIRTGEAVKNAGEVMKRAVVVGENLAKIADYLVVGESIPGGTTTALAVLLALGFDARGKVSSSMEDNPHDLKIGVAEAGLRAAGISFGSLSRDPLRAIECVGDPVMPALAGLVKGVGARIPVLLAGGTQMGAVAAILKSLAELPENLAIATTRWIASDSGSDLAGIVRQIVDIPIVAADLNFGGSRFEGLRMYEAGAVKEGVGTGGAAVASVLKSRGRVTARALIERIEANYELLLGSPSGKLSSGTKGLP